MLKDLSCNRCSAENCNFRTTPEGFFCRRHWDIVPGSVKAWCQAARITAVNAVKAYEKVP